MLWTTAVAFAGTWQSQPTYVQPHLGLGGVWVNGVTHVQASLGADVGQRWRFDEAPYWLDHARASATGLYGVTSGSLGADFRVGNFIGPDGKVATLQVGPDLWFNGYGDVGSEDYLLPWAPGLDLRTMVVGKLAKGVRLIGEGTPGWAFDARRQSDPRIWGLFDQASILGALALSFDDLRVTVGWSRVWDSSGTRDMLVLGGGI